MIQQVHDLKTLPLYFDDILHGRKRFEYRKDDRDPKYRVGDALKLREWDPHNESYTGRFTTVVVTYKMSKGFDLPEGYCILSIWPLDEPEPLAKPTKITACDPEKQWIPGLENE